MELINKEDVLKVMHELWGDSGELLDRIKDIPEIDAIPVGCLELERRDCAFAVQCDMGSSWTMAREKACKNIIEWWKTPSYDKCLEVAGQRGFIKKHWR